MRLMFTLANTQTSKSANVYVDTDDSIRTAEIIAEAERAMAADVDEDRSPVTYYVGMDPLDPTIPVADSGIRDGAVVTMARGGLSPLPLRADCVVELRVVGGHGAGDIVRCGAGVVAIGSAESVGLRIQAAGSTPVPDVALLARVAEDRTVTLTPVNGYIGASIDGETLTTERPWAFGQQLLVEGVLIELDEFSTNGAHLVPSADKSEFEYNRPPRILPPESATRFSLPSPPGEAPNRGINILTAIAPLAIGVGTAVATGNYGFLLIALLSPVIMIFNQVAQRRSGKKSHRKVVENYWDTRKRIEADALEALTVERAEWLASTPDPALIYEIATTPLPQLWARRRDDPDHLFLRVGTATQPSKVTLDDPEELSHKRSVKWDALDVPAIISLKERGVVGIAGTHPNSRQVSKWAVAQLAVMQSPKDVRFYLFTESKNAADWEWFGWLPHAKSENSSASIRNIGTSTATIARCVAEIVAIIETRKAAGVGSGKSAPIDDIVVIMDGARRLRAMPSLVQILRDGPAVGVYSICIDGDERLLPEECDAFVVVDGENATIRQQRVSLVARIRPDVVSDNWLEWVARSLTPIKDASPDALDGSIPTTSRLLSVINLDPPTPDTITARWLVGGRSTRAVIGESIDGEFALDMSLDGPHGLIAGTTGSGKSELLQTLVASLAVANKPTEMNFVLVDYKGGAAFKDCVDLPHTVGMVTDLDTHQVERALTSLGAELHTREHILAEAGAKDLEDYQAMQAKRPELDSLPRLLIVIDEFASMARELPDFVKGLVNIAQRGRSLGIHLILATQRPGGVVSPEIRANTNLRIALRMTDASESSDVIDSPESANIAKTSPGRAYVRLGASSLMPFQAGRVGGRHPGTQVNSAIAPPLVADLSFSELGDPAPRKQSVDSAEGDVEITDLKVLVDAIRKANTSLGYADQRKPWLPPLSEALALRDVRMAPLTTAETDRGHISFPIGLEDHPVEQEQRPTVLDLDTLGHLFIIGSARSGRSQTLRTIAGSAARRAFVADLHMYGIDCGNGALLPLASLPHCGAVAQRHEPERVARLLQKFVDEVSSRQSLFSASGYAGLVEQRASVPIDERLPHILVLIDQWDGFQNTLGEFNGGALVEQVQFLLREGASVGIHIIMSGDRMLFSSRMSSLVDRKILLNMADRSEFSNEGINPKKLPEVIPPGRGFWNSSATETQIALLSGEATGQGQAASLKHIGSTIAKNLTPRDRATRPFRIDSLPGSISMVDATAAVPAENLQPGFALVGVGGDELTGFGADLFGDQNVFIVGGTARSGRSSLLSSMAHSLLANGTEVVILAPRLSPLRDLEGVKGVRGVLTGETVTDEELTALVPEGTSNVVVIVDDAQLHKESADATFRSIMSTGRDNRIGLVVAGLLDEFGSGFRGWQIDAKKARRGVLLNPQSIVDGELIGTKLSRSVVGKQTRPGLGLFHGSDLTVRELRIPFDTK